MNRRGVCYDVGRVMWGQNWRPDFRPAEVRRELQIIRADLHCNAVRICGRDIDRLVVAAQDALNLGLEVWFSPELWDRSPDETLAYIAEAAAAAATLRSDRTDGVVLSVGSESTLFMACIVEGNTVFERLGHPAFWEHVRTGAHNGPLNAFLAQAAERARKVFAGSITYASVPLETVDWRPFDIVSVDLYRDARIKNCFADMVRPYLAHGRPVAITESGCCTYTGAADAGGHGFDILDIWAGDSTPFRLKGDHLRDEAEQATEVSDLLRIFDRARRRRHLRHDFRRAAQPNERRSEVRPRHGELRPRQELRRTARAAGRGAPGGAVAAQPIRNDLSRHALGAKGGIPGGRGFLRWQRLMPRVQKVLDARQQPTKSRSRAPTSGLPRLGSLREGPNPG